MKRTFAERRLIVATKKLDEAMNYLDNNPYGHCVNMYSEEMEYYTNLITELMVK